MVRRVLGTGGGRALLPGAASVPGCPSVHPHLRNASLPTAVHSPAVLPGKVSLQPGVGVLLLASSLLGGMEEGGQGWGAGR